MEYAQLSFEFGFLPPVWIYVKKAIFIVFNCNDLIKMIIQ